MATIQDVARRAGVASVTVSRVINDSGPVSSDVRRRVEAAIRELGYVPNALAQGLKRRSSRTLALVVTDITSLFSPLVARGVEDVAQAHGYSVILCNTDLDREKQARYLDMVRQKRVDGLVLVPVADAETIVSWRRHQGPICLLGHVMPDLDWRAEGIDVVRGEGVRSTRALVEHLLWHGHRRIGMVSGGLDRTSARERVEGYRQALVAAGQALDVRLERPGRNTLEWGRSATAELLALPDPPTALVAANRMILVGMLTALRERRIEVPRDVAVAAADEIPPMALADPPVTAAEQPAEQLGRLAARFVLDRLGVRFGDGGGAVGQPAGATAGAMTTPPSAEGRSLVLESRVVIRRSCGCAEAAAAPAEMPARPRRRQQ